MVGMHPLWEALTRHLEQRRGPIQEEIRRYPAPIAGCDAHFNYLLEQRAVLSRELVRLAEASRAAGTDVAAAVEAFIRSSTCIDAEAAERLCARSEASTDPNVTHATAPAHR